MNDDGETIELNTKGLDQLVRALKGKLPQVRVGILGSKSNRGNAKDGQTNASIGAEHEFGSSRMPVRSFLRMPISTFLNKKMENSGAFDEDVLRDVVKQATIVPWLKKVAVLAEAIVQEAFDTSGWGQWPKWRNPNYRNGNNRILDDTGQLRDSITSEVK